MHFQNWVSEIFLAFNLVAQKVVCAYLVSGAIGGKVEGEEIDETTMKTIQRIANTIHTSIQVTIDYPSNHTNRRMPVLDLEQWMEEIEIHGEKKYQILHSHYMKDIRSQKVI